MSDETADLQAQVTALQGRVGALEDEVSALQSQIAALQKPNAGRDAEADEGDVSFPVAGPG
jgi:outer membrane murein-binding lipoprotein Lpp